jgi:ribosome biogenesis GTPase
MPKKMEDKYMDKINLYEFGLNDFFVKEFNEKYSGRYLGRVIEEQKSLYKIITEKGKLIGKVSGKISYNASSRLDFPAVGDWVVLDREDDKNGYAIIEGILTRKSKFSRKIAGKRREEQIIAANIDILFITMALNNDFNLRRLDRYKTLAWNSGATPVILLTKADLCDDVEKRFSDVSDIALGIDIVIVSAVEGTGLDKLVKYIKSGITAAFVGSSGVGKSTLINYFLGEQRQSTQQTRNDDRGRHTTTYKELILIPSGGIIIDTPGMREMGLLDDVESIDDVFRDIEELSKLCRFSDCSHQHEPDCAVKGAISKGELSEERFQNYLKLKREAEYMERKLNKNSQRSYLREMKKRNKFFKKDKY